MPKEPHALAAKGMQKRSNIMKWKRIISGVLAAGMLLSAPVQLPASAEGTDAAQTPNVWENLLTMDDID